VPPVYCSNRVANASPGAPEASHHTEFLVSGPNLIDFSADIFSLGGVTSEAIVWMAFGKDGIDQYFEFRKAAMSQIPAFNGSGYEGCFHDGLQCLTQVDQMHERVLKALPDFDKITPRVIELVQKRMLRGEVGNRWPADKLEKQFDLDYGAAEKEMVVPGHLHIVTDAKTSNPASPLLSSPLQLTSPSSVSGYGSTRPLSAESIATMGSLVAASFLTTPSPSALTRGGERPLSTESTATSYTLDGVHGHHGEAMCICNTEPTRPGPCPIIASSSRPVSQSSESPPQMQSLFPAALVAQQTEAGSGTLVQSPSVSGLRAHSSIRSSSSARSRPRLSLGELWSYREMGKRRIQSIPDSVKETIEDMKNCIDGRDHLFIVDDSETMGVYKEQLIRAFSSFSYVAKEVDKDGLELILISKHRKVYSKRQTSKLCNKIRRSEFNSRPDMMEDRFDGIVRDHIIPRLARSKKPLSVLIFTDGCWGDDATAAAGVQNPVKHLMQWLVGEGIGRTRVMLSFIRFGHDDLGIRHLNYLDDCGKAKQFLDRYNRSRAWYVPFGQPSTCDPLINKCLLNVAFCPVTLPIQGRLMGIYISCSSAALVKTTTMMTRDETFSPMLTPLRVLARGAYAPLDCQIEPTPTRTLRMQNTLPAPELGPSRFINRIEPI
jgi:hypothetical protein